MVNHFPPFHLNFLGDILQFVNEVSNPKILHSQIKKLNWANLPANQRLPPGKNHVPAPEQQEPTKSPKPNEP
jgi:hypothetical protein